MIAIGCDHGGFELKNEIIKYLESEKLLFSGDTLFMRSIGRCDLPTGDYETIEKSIKNKIYTLKNETVVYPGHGNETTVGYEKINNGFVTE